MIIQSPKIMSSDGFLATVQNSSPNAWWKMNQPGVPPEEIGQGYLGLPGVTQYYATAPSAASLRFAGSFQLSVRVSPAAWVPSAQQTFVARDTSGTTHSFRFGLSSTGKLSVILSSDGATPIVVNSTVNPAGVVNNQPIWMHLVYTGGTGNVQFYQAADQATEPTVWTQVGADVASGVLSIFAGTHALEIGSISVGTAQLLIGRIYRTIAKDSGGTVVFDANFTTLPTNTKTFNESSSNAAVVTINGLSTGGQFAHGTLKLPGVAGYFAKTPSSAALQITGPMDIILRVAAAAWNAPTVNEYFLSKSIVSGQFCYDLRHDVTTGKIHLRTSTDGTTFVDFVSSVNTGVADGAYKWLKVSYQTDNGAAQRQVNFFTSDDGVTWTALGTAQLQATAAATKAGTDSLAIGGQPETGGTTFNGNIDRVIIKNGIGGTVVFDADFTLQSVGTTTFTESSVNAAIVTVAGPVAADYVSSFSSEAIALNGAIFGAVGPVVTDPAMTFDGVNDQLVTQSISLVCGQSALSVFGFIKTATTAKALMFSSGASNDLTFSIITNKLLLTLFDHTTTDTLPGSASVVDNAWHEVGFVISANHCQMYVDGLPDGGNTLISGTFAGAQAAVLRLMTDTTNFFNGSAQHWRVYQRALSAAEVARIYARRNIR